MAEFDTQTQDWRSINMGEYAMHEMPDINEYPGVLFEGVAADATLLMYASEAERRGVQNPELPEDEAFCVDRTAYGYSEYVRGDRGLEEIRTWLTWRDRLDPEAVAERTALVGCFAGNGGFTAYVDGSGRFMLTRTNPANVQALLDAGFERSSFTVPFSIGDTDFSPRQPTHAYLTLMQELGKRDDLMAAMMEGKPYVDPADTMLGAEAVRHLIERGTVEDYFAAAAELNQARVLAQMDAELEGPAAKLAALEEQIAGLREQIRSY